MADVNRGNRPLSPHIMIYRPQITALSSIMVRITAIALLVLTTLVVWWLLAASNNAGAFAAIDGFLRSWFGDLILLGATWALWYHLLGRLRHVIWDLGYGWNLEFSKKMGWGMYIIATALTLITIIVL